jgi:peptidoglycan/LPS O-acetylase OafA/YrhL
MFPLLLLMVRRRGLVFMVGTVTLVVAAVGISAPHVSRLEAFVIQSPPDLAALFAVGIVSAGIVGASGAVRSWPWAGLALAAAMPVLATVGWRGSVWTIDHLFWVDLALAPAIGCLLAGLATGRAARVGRLLDTGPIRRLGSSSYSLYLTHGPIVVVVCDKLVVGRVREGVPAFVASLALVVPLTIAFARVFASVFETPFRSSPSCAERRTRKSRPEADDNRRPVGDDLSVPMLGCPHCEVRQYSAPAYSTLPRCVVCERPLGPVTASRTDRVVPVAPPLMPRRDHELTGATA